MLYSPQAAQIVANSQAREYSNQIRKDRLRKELRNGRNQVNPFKRLLNQLQRTN